jgi:heptosyltransferase-2
MSTSRNRKILIIRQDRLGDVVLSTALPREIRRQWPEARISVMVRPYAAAVFANNPHVDEILLDDPPLEPRARKASFWSLVRELRVHHFSHALMLLPQKRYAYACFCAGIPVRVGVGAILYHLLTGTRFVMRHKYRENRHEADFSMDLARHIGVRDADDTPEIPLSAEEQDRREALRERWGRGRRTVGVHVSSGASAPNWPPERYREFLLRLAADPTLRVLVTDNEVPPAVDGLDGILYPNRGVPLREAIVHFSALDLLVSASTGPMHVCGALGVPTLSMFCPLPACAPERWRPRGNRAEILLPESGYCETRCPGDPKSCHYDGSAELSVGSLVERLMALLRGLPPRGGLH